MAGLFHQRFASAGGTALLLRILSGLLVLGLLVAFVYRDAPSNDFHFDDRDNIVDHLPLHIDKLDIASLQRAWSEPLLASRPLPSVTFAVDWWRGQGQPAPFQVTNLLLHFGNTALVFLLVGWVARRSRTADAASETRIWLGSLLAAGLWAAHPIQVQAVTYIVQRMAELSALFSLVSVYCYIRGRTAPRYRPLWLAAAMLTFGLGALSKENAWIVPGLWWLAEFGLCRTGRPAIGSGWDRLIFALPFVVALYAAIDLLIGGVLADRFLPGYAGRDFGVVERLLTQPRVVLFHLSQLLWPAPGRFSVEHDFGLSTGLFTPPTTAAALILILVWCAMGLRALVSERFRAVGFWMLWLPLSLVPESTVVPLEMVFEHRMYLPSVGLAGLFGLVLADRRAAGRMSLTVAATGLLALLWITPQQVRFWRDDLSLYQNAIQVAPNSPRAWSGWGESLVKAGRTAEAKVALERALKLDPTQYGAWEKIGVIHMDAGDLAGAERALREAHRLSGGKHTVANHIGELYMLMENPAAALDQFVAATERRPDEAIYRWNQAVALEKLGHCQAAAAQWQVYLRLEPDPDERARVASHLAEGCGSEKVKQAEPAATAHH